jgi:putative membrane protein insertion efficiency factor
VSIKLLAVLLVAAVMTFDWARPPARQVSAAAYEKVVVGSYRRFIRPHTAHFIRCRFEPTCSNYSVEAVQRYGFPKGVCLTAWRMARCMPWVPMGTHDPVPRQTN